MESWEPNKVVLGAGVCLCIEHIGGIADEIGQRFQAARSRIHDISRVATPLTATMQGRRRVRGKSFLLRSGIVVRCWQQGSESGHACMCECPAHVRVEHFLHRLILILYQKKKGRKAPQLRYKITLERFSVSCFHLYTKIIKEFRTSFAKRTIPDTCPRLIARPVFRVYARTKETLAFYRVPYDAPLNMNLIFTSFRFRKKHSEVVILLYHS